MATKYNHHITTNKRLPLFLSIVFLIIALPLALYFARNPNAIRADWWPQGSSWEQRRQITLSNNTGEDISAGNAVSITFDTKSLVDLGQLQPDCDDIRVIYQATASTFEEIPFALAPLENQCSTSTATRIFFSLQSALNTNTSTSAYYVYFDNDKASASSLTNEDAFDLTGANATLVCQFHGTTTCVSNSTPSTSTGSLRYPGAGSALYLHDSNSQYATAADSTSLSITGNATVEAWVKLAELDREQTIVAKWDETTANDDRSYRLYMTSGNKAAFAVSTSGTSASVTSITSSTSLTQGTWYHLAGVYNASAQTLDIYLNGSSDATQVGSAGSSIDNNSSLLYLGAKENTSGSADTLFSGIIDEVRISQIIRYSQNFTPNTLAWENDDQTAALYHFDEQGLDPRQNNKALDLSNNSNHATLSGSPLYISGMVGIDQSSEDVGQFHFQSASIPQGLYFETSATNKIFNPSFEAGDFDVEWTASATMETQNITTSTEQLSTYSTHLRKTWFDGTRYWASLDDGTNIEFWYSTDGSSWTQNNSATISNEDYRYSVWGNETEAYLARVEGLHIYTYKASSYPGTGFSWSASTTAFDGSGATDAWSEPFISQDSNGYVWLMATHVGSSIYEVVAMRATNANSIATWPDEDSTSSDVIVGSSNNTLNRGSLVPLNDGDMFAVFTVSSDLFGCIYDEQTSDRWEDSSGNDCTGGTNKDTISTGYSLGNGYSVAQDITNNDIHVTYRDTTSNTISYRRWDNSSGTNGTWQSEVDLITSATGYDYAAVTTDLTTADPYMMIVDTSPNPDNVRYSFCDQSAASSSCDSSSDWISITTLSSGTNQIRFAGLNIPTADRVFGLWTDNTASPYDVDFRVILAPNTVSATETTTFPYVKFGDKSAKVEADAISTFVTSIDPNSTSTHTISVYLYRGTSGNVGGTIDENVVQIIWEGDAKDNTSDGVTYTAMGNGWYRVAYSAATTDVANEYGLEIAAGEDLYIDGFQLEATSTTTTFTEGDMGTGYSWTGTQYSASSTRGATDLDYAVSGNIAAAAGSISFWLKPNWDGDDNLEYTFFDTDTSSGTLKLYKTTGNNLTLTDGTNTATISTTGWNKNEWHHIVATWDGSNYLDIFDNTSAGTGSGAYSTPTLGTSLYIGQSKTNANLANAEMTDIRFYDSALNSTQVTDIYYSGLVSQSLGEVINRYQPTKGETPLAEWRFDEGQGTTAHDASGNNYHLTLSGATWQQSQTSSQIGAKFLRFDGTDDYARKSNDTAFNPNTNSFTLDGWFRHTATTPSSGTDTLVAKYGTAGYKVYMNTSGYLCFGIDDDATWSAKDEVCSTSVQGNLADSKWHRFTAVKSSTSSITLYIDGKSANQDSSLAASNSLSSNAHFNIGIDSDGSSNAWEGDLDQLAWYDYARDSGQIASDQSASQDSVIIGQRPSDNLNQGLVGYWPMDDNVSGNAQTILDKSGNGNNGTTNYGANTTGMDCTVAGKFGTGCDFDGSDDQISISTSASGPLDLDIISISAWVNTNSSSGITRIYQRDSSTYGLYQDDSDVVFYIDTTIDGGNNYTLASTISQTTWTHVVGTYDGKEMRLYVNGVQVNNRTQSGLVDNGSTSAYIASSGSSQYFDGILNQLRLYNRALTPAEIRQLADWAPGPVAHYSFDANTGTSSIIDDSGNGHTGTMQGSMTESDWVPGKYGSGLEFDGTNDLIDLGTNFDQANTVAAWVKSSSTSGNHRIITNGESAIDWTLQMNTGHFVITNATSGSNTAFTTTASYNDGEWHHVAANISTLDIYVDGQKAAGALGSSTLSVDGNAKIGAKSTSQYFFLGSIDEVKIWDYSLTPAQIIEDMNAGHPLGGSPIGSQIAHWNFDEGYGDTAHDALGNYNGNLSGTCPGGINCPTWQITGKNNGSLFFDGNDYFTTSFQPNSWSAASFTLWFKLSGTGTTFPFGFNSSSDSFYTYLRASDGLIGFGVEGTNLQATSTGITTGTWYHLAGIYESGMTNGKKIYLNGKLVATGTQTGAITASNPLYVGYRSTGNYFSGNLDKMKIYNVALTPEQIAIDYNSGSSLSAGGVLGSSESSTVIDGDANTNLVAYYPLDENTGSSTTADKSGSNYPGNLTSITEQSWVPGKHGSALSLDGTADFVDIGTGPTSVKTITMWVKPTSTTTPLVNLTSTTDYISASSGTISATGFTSPTIYVNGKSSTTLTANTWQHVAVVTDTAENASNLDLGRTADTNYLSGVIDEVKLFSSALTQAQIAYEYNRGAPIGWWRMDECSGTTINDDSGNNNHGTITAGNSSGDNDSVGTCDSGNSDEMWHNGASGKYDASLDFDGTNDKATITNPDEDDFGTGTMSVAAWIKTSTTGTVMEIVDNKSAGTNNAGFNLQVNSSNQIMFRIANGSNQSGATSTQTVTDGNWHHVVGTLTRSGGTDNLKIYIDGIQVISNNVTGGYNITSSQDLIIGSHGSTAYFNGQIDDVRLYNYTLSANQVKNIYNHGAVRFGE